MIHVINRQFTYVINCSYMTEILYNLPLALRELDFFSPAVSCREL